MDQIHIDSTIVRVLNMISFYFKEGFALTVDDGLIWCISGEKIFP